MISIKIYYNPLIGWKCKLWFHFFLINKPNALHRRKLFINLPSITDSEIRPLLLFAIKCISQNTFRKCDYRVGTEHLRGKPTKQKKSTGAFWPRCRQSQTSFVRCSIQVKNIAPTVEKSHTWIKVLKFFINLPFYNVFTYIYFTLQPLTWIDT